MLNAFVSLRRCGLRECLRGFGLDRPEKKRAEKERLLLREVAQSQVEQRLRIFKILNSRINYEYIRFLA